MSLSDFSMSSLVFLSLMDFEFIKLDFFIYTYLKNY